MEIRLCQASDHGAVEALWGGVFGYPEARNAPARVLADKLAVDDEGLLVAVDEGGLLGTLMFGYDGHRGWLYRLAVVRQARGQGVARALVEAAEARLAARGCLKVNLQVKAGNQAAVKAWEHLGYRVEPRVSLGKVLGGAQDGGC